MSDKTYYRGYSSALYTQTGTLTLQDIQLVKMDLLTHIFTKKGSRVMMADYGTRIPEMPFEMLNEELLSEIYDELKYVIDSDPRVQLINLAVTPYYDINTVIAAAVIRYVEFDVVDVLNIEFNDSTLSQ